VDAETELVGTRSGRMRRAGRRRVRGALPCASWPYVANSIVHGPLPRPTLTPPRAPPPPRPLALLPAPALQRAAPPLCVRGRGSRGQGNTGHNPLKGVSKQNSGDQGEKKAAPARGNGFPITGPVGVECVRSLCPQCRRRKRGGHEQECPTHSLLQNSGAFANRSSFENKPQPQRVVVKDPVPGSRRFRPPPAVLPRPAIPIGTLPKFSLHCGLHLE